MSNFPKVIQLSNRSKIWNQAWKMPTSNVAKQ